MSWAASEGVADMLAQWYESEYASAHEFRNRHLLAFLAALRG
jgi:hypothetical protein